MEKSVFQQSPVELLLERNTQARGLPQFSVKQPDTSGGLQEGAPAKITKQDFDEAAAQLNVPANVLMAVSDLDGSASRESILANAQRMRAALDKGDKVEDIFAKPVLDRAAQIGREQYGASDTAKEVSGPGFLDVARDMALQVSGGVYKGTGSIVRGAGEALQAFAREYTAPIINRIFNTEYEPGNVLDPVADVLHDTGKRVQSGVSEDTKRAIANSSPDGDITKPSTWTLGNDPSLRGYAALTFDVFGGMVPIIAASAATAGSATAGAVVGGLQGGGAAAEQAREAIDEMAKTRDPKTGEPLIAQQSAYYRQLRDEGRSHEQAVQAAREAAEQVAFLLTTPVSALGGAATSKIVNPAEHILGSRGIATRIAGRAALGAAEEGAQEATETVATNAGINAGAGADRSLTDGTFGDFLLGAITGGATGAGAGALSERQQHVAAAPTTPPAAPASEPGPATPGGMPSGDVPLQGEILPPEQKQLPGPLQRAAARGLPSPYPIVTDVGEPQAPDVPSPAQAPMPPVEVPAPPVASAADATPQRIRVEAEGVDAFDGVVEFQSPREVTILSEGGERFTIPTEEISSGSVRITPLGAEAPYEQPPVSASAEASSPAQPAVEEPITGGATPEPGPSREAFSPIPTANYASMGREELQARMSYLEQQARTNGGWGRRLLLERAKVLEALAALGKDAANVRDDRAEGSKAAVRMGAPLEEGGKGAPEGARSGASTAEVAASGVPEGMASANAEPERGAPLIDAAAHEAATSPTNARPEPTQAQKEAGNYKVGRLKIGGLDISIENPQGSERKGKDSDGKEWSVQMKHHYGYIRGTIGRDKDHVDVFVRPGVSDLADDAPVFVIDQLDQKASGFDEHKVMLGYENRKQAERAYLSNYTKGWNGLGDVTEMSLAQFREWSRNPEMTKRPASSPKPKKIIGRGALRVDESRPDAPQPMEGREWKGEDLAAPKWMRDMPEAVTEGAGRGKYLYAITAGKDEQIGGVDFDVEDGAVVIRSSGLAKTARGHGLVTKAYKDLATWASGHGLELRSDSSLTVEAAKVYGRLGADGYTVERNPRSTERDGALSAPAGEPVFTVRKAGAEAQAEPAPYNQRYAEDWHESNGEAIFDAIAKVGGRFGDAIPNAVKAGASDKELLAIIDKTGKQVQTEGGNGYVIQVTKGPKVDLTLIKRAGSETLNLSGKKLADELRRVFPQTVEELSGQSKVANEKDAASTETAPKTNYGADNTFVTADRAAELRERLKKKLRTQLNAGVDPEVLAIGAELAAFHIEAGARKFAEFTKAMARDLDTTVEKIRPYLRAWYNGARDMMEDAGQDIAGTDGPDVVRSELEKIGKEATDGPGELDRGGARPLEGVPAAEVRGDGASGDAEAGADGRGRADAPRNERAGGRRADDERSVGDGAREVPAPTRGEPEGRARGERGGEDVQRADASAERIPEGRERVADAEPAPAPLADRVLREAFAVHGKNGVRVLLRDLRPRLPDVGKDELDAALKRLQAEGKINLYRLDNRVEITDQDREAAFYVAGEPRHLVWVLNEAGAPAERPASGKPASDRPSDFAHTSSDDVGRGGAKTKFRNNVAAVRLLKKLEAEGRSATRDEQAVLAKFVGWGGLPQAFERSKGEASKGWATEVAELKSVLTEEELRAAAASTRNAHYTSPEIVKAMWGAMRHLGFKGGRVLEPSVGVGNFFGLMSPDMRNKSALHGVELDNITGGIAKQLYPAAKIVAPMGFQDYIIPDGHFDVVIGNPPFGAEKLYDGRRKDLSGFSIHNYFFAKSIDGLRPGGVLAMVVTNWMMDAAGDNARRYISDRAELLGAIRLPNDAFLANAGTSVTTDIVFLRKRSPGEGATGESWMEVRDFADKNGKNVPLNEYFHRHPEMMLGEFGAFGTMYRADDAALVAREDQDTEEALADAIASLPSNAMAAQPKAVHEEQEAIPSNVKDVRVGSMFLDGDAVKVREEDRLGVAQSRPADFSNEKAKARVVGMIRVRDAFADVRRFQLSKEATDQQIEKARAALNDTYDRFVRANGPINLDANKRLFRDDPSWPQIAALEDGFDKGVSPAVAEKTGEKARKPSAKKAAVFSKRTQRPYAPPSKANSAKDALVASLSETGRVDMDMMKALYGKPAEAIVSELGDLVFSDPVRGLVTRDEYLSGNVKRKLAEAKDAAANDRAMERNVAALEAVQPPDIDAIDIRVKPGAHWLPRETMVAFAANVSGDEKPDLIYNPVSARWSIRVSPTTEAAARWATERASLSEVLEAAANQRTITVRDRVDENTTRVNEAQTQLANDKIAAVAEEWQRWIWSDDDRRARLSRLYNDMFNTDVQREYDGSHLKLPGKVSDDIISLRPHQSNAIWRVMQSGTTLLDHVVGAGKTFTMVGAAMELRRTGLAKKPMFLVPNHLVSQWAADFVKLYPGAQVLATSKADFEKENRKKLFARIATGDWDAVIVAHSSFGKVEVEPAEQAAFIEEQIADLQKSQEIMREAEGKSGRNVKQIENQITLRREKLKKLLDAQNKDDSLYWGELGVDALFVDEAHEFKNLEFSTGMQRVAGLGNPTGSQKASDLYLKVRQVLKATGGRNVTFATGTPISNTMAEMFTMQRYLDYRTLDDQGIAHFDAWARMFGEVVTDWELSPSGQYKMNSRFAKFVNIPELMQRYGSFADVVNRDDINRMLAAQGKRLPVPRMKGGRPENVVVSRSAEQGAYIGMPIKDLDGNDTDTFPRGTLVWRAENLPKKVEKGADNMLKVMSDARKAALDMRMINPDAGDHAGSKVNVAADRIKAAYDRWQGDLGTQLVFIDLSTPKGARADEAARVRDLIARADNGDAAAAEELEKISPDEIDALNTAFSVYDDLKAKLVSRGIPAGEVAFIHDAKTDIQKSELFGKVRSGRVRVLLGSTAKMGAGTNVQDRLVALHHLDAPWRPSDLEQREGRIIRQGNLLYDRDPDGFEVEVLRYATKQTLDSRMWQTIEGKARFIEQVRKGNTGAREVEDIGGETANAAEMKAASSGNPLILEEMTLRQQVKRLETERYGHEQGQFRIRDTIRATKRRIETDTKVAAQMREDAKVKVPEEFQATIDGETYETRKEVGAAILKEAALAEALYRDSAPLGNYGGFKLTLDRVAKERFIVTISAEGEYQTKDFGPGADPAGLAQRIVNAVAGLDEEAADREAWVARSIASLPKIEAEVREWSKSAELDGLKARHREIIDKLRPKRKDAEQAKTDDGSRPSDVVEGADEATPSIAMVADGFSSVVDAQAHLRNSAYGAIIQAMIDAGRVIIHGDTENLPGIGRGRKSVGGLATNDGTIHLVAGNLTPRNIESVLLHEAFHANGKSLLGDEQWQRLLDRVGRIMQTQINKPADQRSFFWRRAIGRVEKARTPDKYRAEEFAAYAIEHYALVPEGVRSILDSLIGRMKAWLLEKRGWQLGKVTPAQLHALAIAALRMKRKADAGSEGERFSTIGRDLARIRKFLTGAPVASMAGDEVPRLGKTANLVQWAASYFSTKINGQVQHSELGEIKVDKRSARDTLGHGYGKDKIQAIFLLPDAIKKSIVVAEEGRATNQIGYVLAAPVTIGGRAYVLTSLVKRTPERTGLYVHEVFLLEKLRGAINTAATSDLDGSADQTRDDPGAIRRVLHEIFAVNDEPDTGERFSVIGDEPEAEKQDRWFRNTLSDTLTKAMPALLAAAPLRSMLEELTKGMSAAKGYLQTKQAMDTLRNEWHGRVAETADRWLKYRSFNRAENGKLMDLMHDSTLEQADPSKPFEPLFGSKEATILRYGDNESAEYEEAKKKAVQDKARRAAWKGLKERFDAMSPEARALYEEVRDTYTDLADEFERTILGNMDKALKVAVRKAEREHRKEMQRIADDGLTGVVREEAIKAADKKLQTVRTKTTWNARWRLNKMRAAFESNRLAGPYFPLARFGQLFVTVRDETGAVVSFSRFESPTKMRRFADEMEKAGYKVERGVLADPASLRRQVDPNFVADVEDILEGASVPSGIKDEIWQRFLERMPDYSLRKKRIHRVGRAGFHADAMRAFASNMFHGAHQLARTHYGMDLSEHIADAREQAKTAADPVRAGLVLNELEKRHEYVMNPEGSSWAQALTSATFVYNLAASPAAALVNLSQTVIIGIPILGAYHGGNAIAANELGKAMKDFTAGRGKVDRSASLTSEERDAMVSAYNLGVVDKSQAHDLAGVGETGVEYSAVRQKVMAAISWAFHQTERLNREVTYLAAYRLARKKGDSHPEAIAAASKLTWKTHFDYQNTSRPRFMQHDGAKVLLVFRNYNVNMLFRLFRDTHQAMQGASEAERKEARAQLFGITAMMALNAGIKGTWLFGIAMTLAGIFFGMAGHGDDDPEEEFQKAVIKLLGPHLGGVALNGAPGHLTGTALSGRIGMPDLWFRSPDRQLEGEDAFNYWTGEFLGASSAIPRNIFRGFKLISEGEVQRGIEVIAPKAVRDLMKAYRYATEGVTTINGDRVVQNVSWGDVFKQAIGFTPAEIAAQYEVNSWLKNKQDIIVKRRKQIIRDFGDAIGSNDKNALQKVEGRLIEFNNDNSDYAIMGRDIVQSVKSKQKAHDQNEGGIRLNPKLNQRLRENAPPNIYD